jgi:DNA-binding response OmpR family regulator
LTEAKETSALSRASFVLLAEAGNGSNPVAECWKMRVNGNLSPILLLLEREQEARLPTETSGGADEIAVVPAHPREIVRRALALLDRPSRWPDLEQVGPLTIDWANPRVLVQNRHLVLTETERSLLCYLAYRRHRAGTSAPPIGWDELGLVVFGVRHDRSARTAARHLSSLRRKISEVTNVLTEPFETVHGVGCRLREGWLSSVPPTAPRARCNDGPP